jgi:predicted transcriptional regulator
VRDEHATVRLPEELATRVDVAATVADERRTAIVVEALQQYLGDLASRDDFRESVVELYLAEEIEFEQLTAVIGRHDAEAVRSAKRRIDDGAAAVSDLADL